MNKSLKPIHQDIIFGKVPFEVKIGESTIAVNKDLLLEYINEKIKQALEDGVKLGHEMFK